MIIQNNTFQPHVTLKSPSRIWNVEKSPKKRKNFQIETAIQHRHSNHMSIQLVLPNFQGQLRFAKRGSQMMVLAGRGIAKAHFASSRVLGFFLHTHAYAVVVSSFSRRDVTSPRHTRFANVKYGQEKWTYRGEWFKLYLLMTNLQYGANVAN